MKKQICAKGFKLRSSTYSRTDLRDMFQTQVSVLMEMAERKAWQGTRHFWPGLPGPPDDSKKNSKKNSKNDSEFDFFTVKEKISGMSEEYKQRWIKEFVLCLHAEASELLDLINWKHWKDTPKKVDWEEAKFEIVDLLIFVMNLSLAAGMGPSELAQRFEHKAKINITRQQNKY